MKVFELYDHPKIERLDPDEYRSKLFNYIGKNCSEFIDEGRSGIDWPRLYRGARSVIGTSDIQIISPPVNRYTKDMSPDEQEMVDIKLKNMGLTAIRSNSIFCTGNYGSTLRYGELFLIFPMNGFSYTWSPAVPDLADISYTTIKNNFNSLGFINTNLAEAIESGNEILIHGKSLMINFNWSSRTNFMK